MRYNPHGMKFARTIPKSRLLVAVLLMPLGALLPACSPEPTPTPVPLEEQLPAIQEAVYRAVFAEIYGTPRMYVLAQETKAGVDGGQELQVIIESLRGRLPGMQETTGQDFILHNRQSLPLPRDMDLGLPYVLFSDEEFNEIFNINTSAWDVFYTRYPNSPGITTLSQVGFNPGLTQALVYVGTWSNWLAGVGYYLLLEKVDDAWLVTGRVVAWIS